MPLPSVPGLETRQHPYPMPARRRGDDHRDAEEPQRESQTFRWDQAPTLAEATRNWDCRQFLAWALGGTVDGDKIVVPAKNLGQDVRSPPQ